jgi:hypothetical protein
MSAEQHKEAQYPGKKLADGRSHRGIRVFEELVEAYANSAATTR